MASSVPSNVITWLMDGPAYVRHRTRLDVLGHSQQDAMEAVSYTHLRAHETDS